MLLRQPPFLFAALTFSSLVQAEGLQLAPVEVTTTEASAGEIAQAQLDIADQDLLMRVSQAYFDVLAAQDTLNVVQAQKKAIAEQFAAAKSNFELGNATITDSREAQARQDLAEAQEIAALNDLQVKQLGLDQVVGRASIAPRPLAQPVVLPQVEPADLNQWVDAAE